MKEVGFNRPLYVLPFDHRASFETKLFGFEGPVTSDQTTKIAEAKDVIYDGFLAAIAAGLPSDRACVLVDEQFGAAILRDAAVRGHATAMPAERSGQDEFEFEYGDDFAQHVEAFRPTFAKALVRYNPQGDATMNRRQSARLKRLSDYLRSESRSGFLFELLVPPEKDQLERFGGDRSAYDLHLRPGLMAQAIQQLQNEGVEPDVWKVEGLDRGEDCERIVATARRAGRENVGCIVLGRGADDAQVRQWLTTAAGVQGFIGFAIGRTDFWDPLVAWRGKRLSRDATVTQIANRYREFAAVFDAGKRR